MRTYILKTGFVFLLIRLHLFCFADGYSDEIRKLSRVDLLPQFQNGVAAKQISSYDTTGGNDDGFSGKYSYLRKENGSLIIADLKGSGIIQRISTPTPSEDTIQFYFDGETTPRIELKFIDLFSGDKYPFLRPVVGNEVGGYYCYLPIPYQSACKIVLKGKRMQFIQIQYNEMGKGQTVSSFPSKFSTEEDQALLSVLNIWKKSGEALYNLLPIRDGSVQSVSKNVVLKPGEVKSIFSHKSGGRIVGIEINPQQPLNDRLKDIILRAHWEDEKVAAINSPVSDFFGYAFGKPSMQSMLVGVRDGVHYCYLPMPFTQDANIELEFLKSTLNQSAEISINVKIYYNETRRSEIEGKFYAQWKREPKTELGKPYEILKTSGRGHYVGTLLQSQGLHSGMTIFFEGDDVCMIDGEMRLHGTGSEDYFNGGWYAMADRWDQAFSLPMHGCLAYSIPMARTGGYRFLMTDKISFDRDFQLSIEHGPENNKIEADYTSVAFYYCDTPPVSNALPAVELLEKINSPQTLEYWLQLLPIKALGKDAVLSYEDCKDVKSGKNYEVFKLTSPGEGFARFEMEVPSNGPYKLYMSYFKGPDGCPIEVNQRQVPVKKMDGYAPEHTLIEKEYIGTLQIKEGTNTITVILKDKDQKSGKNTFLVHRIYLEKV